MRYAFAQNWKKIFRLLARELQIERIGTQIQIAWPFERSEFRDSNLFEDSGAFPCFEHAAPGNVAKIDDARDAVVETEKQFVLFQWIGLCDLHNEFYIKQSGRESWFIGRKSRMETLLSKRFLDYARNDKAPSLASTWTVWPSRTLPSNMSMLSGSRISF
jgi:hypothetical protein